MILSFRSWGTNTGFVVERVRSECIPRPYTERSQLKGNEFS
jgi:hypothetical protein